MKTVAVIVGSLRKDSINKKLAGALENLGSDIMRMSRIDISEIPLFNEDQEMSPPAPVRRLKEAIIAADAVLFVTPEYNRSVPGVLKNVVDWVSRPYGQSAWSGKPAAIAGSTEGAIGTAVSQSHLRSILTILNMPLMPSPEVYFQERPGLIVKDGTITDERTRNFLRNFLVHFEKWIVRTK